MLGKKKIFFLLRILISTEMVQRAIGSTTRNDGFLNVLRITFPSTVALNDPLVHLVYRALLLFGRVSTRFRL